MNSVVCLLQQLYASDMDPHDASCDDKTSEREARSGKKLGSGIQDNFNASMDRHVPVLQILLIEPTPTALGGQDRVGATEI